MKPAPRLGEQMGKKDTRSFYLTAFEHNGYWTIKMHLDAFDSQGTTDEQMSLRTNVKVATIDTPMDQAWLILILSVHFLESQGALGRIRGQDWPPLF
jgi:hypothetical protein